MSGLEANKIIGAALLAGVVASTSGFVTELLMPHEEMAENAYPIAVAAVATGVTEAPAEAALEPVLPLLASADPAAGGKLIKKCTSCHTIEEGGADKVGPNLWGVVGRNIAARSGFSYSAALQAVSAETWSYQNLNGFLAKPKDWAAGTKMSFAGFKKVQDRANVIAYLRTQGSESLPLPAGAEPEAAEPAAPAEEPPAPSEEAAEPAAAEAPSEAAEAAAVQQAAAPTGLGALVAAASAEAGQKIVRKCKACHSLDKDGPNKIGPPLWGVLGRAVASKADFKYSDAMAAMSGETWSYETLDAFVAKPKDYVPGTKMAFPGVKSAEDRAALLAYLRELSDSPLPLPE